MTGNRLEERIQSLEEELEEEREKRQELEEQLEFTQTYLWDLEDTVTGDVSLAFISDDLLSQMKSLEERLESVEKGEVDPETVVKEQSSPDIDDLLPIHQMYLTVTRVDHTEHSLHTNQELAARVFPHFAEYADPSHGRLTLYSTKVKQIIERDIKTPELAERLDVDDPNPNTVKRVMEYLGSFGGDVLAFDNSEKRNRVLADKQLWVEYRDKVVEGSQSADEIDGETRPSESVDPDDAANTVEGDADEKFDTLEAGRTANDQPAAKTDGGVR